MLTDNQLKQIEDKLFDALTRVDSKKPAEWEALARLTDALVSIQTIQTTREMFEEEDNGIPTNDPLKLPPVIW